MKVKIEYYTIIQKEIELTPEEYCLLHANSSSRRDIFPESSFCRKISQYDDLAEKDRRELDNFWDRR